VASRTTVVLPSPDGLDVGENDILQIKHPTAGDPDEIRRAGDPVTLAVLDSPLPDSHPGGLTVTQFVAGDDLNNVAAPAMRPKMVPTGAGILWAVNDIVFLQRARRRSWPRFRPPGQPSPCSKSRSRWRAPRPQRPR